MKLLKAIVATSSISKVVASIYSGGLNLKKLADWINAMDKHFDYEESLEDKKVKSSMTGLKGHASLWWDGA